MHHAEFCDARLVEAYDAEFGWGPDDDFFLAIVNETPAARVLDLGCGTGRLTLALAAEGHRVTGIDPAQASLDAAKAKPGAERVTWIHGTLPVAADRSFDVAVMTSHVAQFFVGDEEWAQTLAGLARVLVPGGVLAFDGRDPRARKWEDWNPITSRRWVTLPGGEVVTIHTEVTEVVDRTVSFTHHYALASGTATSSATLRFRTEDELRTSLTAAGFTIDRLYGGWHREPVGAADGELLVIARRDTAPEGW